MMEVALNQDRLEEFRQKVQVVFEKSKKQSMCILRLTNKVNKGLKLKFSKLEIECALSQMIDAKQILISYDIVSLT